MKNVYLFLLVLAVGCRKDVPVLQPEAASTELTKRSPTTGTSYYFSSSTGNDNNIGTEKRPYKTLAKLKSIKLKAGSKVLLKGGDIFNETLTITASGEANRGIEFTSYGAGIATINSGSSVGITASNQKYLNIHHLSVTGKGRLTNVTDGILMSDCDYIDLSNMSVKGFQHSGLHLKGCEYVLVSYVAAISNGYAGIYAEGAYQSTNHGSQNITIDHCTATDNAGDPTITDNHSGSGILIASSNDVTIRYSTANNNGWDMPRGGNGPVGIWAFDSDEVNINHCISYQNKTSSSGQDGGGFDFDGGVTNSIMEYNLSYENQGAGYGIFQYEGAALFSNNIMRYCVSINDATKHGAGVLVWRDHSSADFKDFYMHNCLVYNSSRPAIMCLVSLGTTNFNFKNNVFAGAGDIVSGTVSGEKFLGNLWWNMEGNPITFRGYPSLGAWAEATGQEISTNGGVAGLQANPLLSGPISTSLTNPNMLTTLSQLRPGAGSPLLNHGILNSQLGISFPTKDFFNQSINQTTPFIGLSQ